MQYSSGKWYYDGDCKNLIDQCLQEGKPLFVIKVDIEFNKSTGELKSHSCTSCWAFYNYVFGTLAFKQYMPTSGFYFACYSSESRGDRNEGKYYNEYYNYVKTLFNKQIYSVPSGFIVYKEKKEYFLDPCSIDGKSGKWYTPEMLIKSLQGYYNNKQQTYQVKFQNSDGTQIGNAQTISRGNDAAPPTVYPPVGDQMLQKWQPSFRNVTSDRTCIAKYITLKDVERYNFEYWDWNIYNTFREKMHSYDRNATVVKNKLMCDLAKTLAKAESEGVPIVAVWTSNCQYELCSHCCFLESIYLQPTFRQWMESSGIYFYYGDPNQGILKQPKAKDSYADWMFPSEDGMEGYRGKSYYWCRGDDGSSAKTFPFVRLYWKKNGKVLVDILTTGYYFTDEIGNYTENPTSGKNPENKPEKYLYASDWEDRQGATMPRRYYPNGRYIRDNLTNPVNGVFKDFFHPVTDGDQQYNDGKFKSIKKAEEIDEYLALSDANGVPVLLQLTSSGCDNCASFANDALKQENIEYFLSRKMYMIRVCASIGNWLSGAPKRAAQIGSLGTLPRFTIYDKSQNLYTQEQTYAITKHAMTVKKLKEKLLDEYIGGYDEVKLYDKLSADSETLDKNYPNGQNTAKNISKVFDLVDNRTYDSVTPGIWNCDLCACIDYSNRNGVPLFAIWTNGQDCVRCEKTAISLLDKPFNTWRKSQNAVFCAVCSTDSAKSVENGTWYEWIRNSNQWKVPGGAQFPFYRMRKLVNGEWVYQNGYLIQDASLTYCADKTDPDYNTWYKPSREAIQTVSSFIADSDAPFETCNVTFQDWDNSILKTETVQYGGEAVPPDVKTRKGYIFSGWKPAYQNIQTDLTCVAQYEKYVYTNPRTVSKINYDTTRFAYSN